MSDRDEDRDVQIGAGKYSDKSPLGTSAEKDYDEPPPAPLFEASELKSWSFWRAGIAEFVGLYMYLFITQTTVIGNNQANSARPCSGVGLLGNAWAYGGMIFVLTYSISGISGGHLSPGVTFGQLLSRKLTVPRALFYMIMQCLGAICGAATVKGMQRTQYSGQGGGVNQVAPEYTLATAVGAEAMGTFITVYTSMSATDSKRMARDSHVPALSPLPIGFAVFLVHLATIPITGSGVNPARSIGAAIIYNNEHTWSQHWIYWVGPFVGATLAAAYHILVIRAMPFHKKT